MTQHRIIQIKKEGYYKYYRVQERFLLVFWVDAARCSFDTISEAQAWIKDQTVRQVATVVHKQ